MKEEFKQTKYIDDYRKKYKSQFNVDLNKEEMKELTLLLRKNNLTKVQFLRNAIVLLKNGNEEIIEGKVYCR